MNDHRRPREHGKLFSSSVLSVNSVVNESIYRAVNIKFDVLAKEFHQTKVRAVDPGSPQANNVRITNALKQRLG